MGIAPLVCFYYHFGVPTNPYYATCVVAIQTDKFLEVFA